MTDLFPPRPTGKPEETVESAMLTGKLIPWGDDDQPVLLRMPMCDDYFLPLFSTTEDLQYMLDRTGVDFAKIKKVDDGTTFLASLPFTMSAPEQTALLRIILDLRFTDEGRTRFTEIRRSMGDG